MFQSVLYLEIQIKPEKFLNKPKACDKFCVNLEQKLW